MLQIKRERALSDAKRNDRARKIKEENRIRRGIISAIKNQKQPEPLEVQQHLDMSHNSSVPSSREYQGMKDHNRAPPFHNGIHSEDPKHHKFSRPGEEGAGGFFVTQHSGDE